MVQVGLNRFAENEKETVDSLFEGTKTFDGYAKRKGNAVIFSDLQKRPFAACVAVGHSAWFVNARKLDNGRMRYQHGADKLTLGKLGLEGDSFMEEMGVAGQVAEHFGIKG